MNCLDSRHIRQIESDVESARITINNLSQELVDHICCEVESLMSTGKSFEEAYAIIKEQTGIKVLQKIQENTLYLIDKKYKAMKTTMKITGNVSLAFIAIGTALKIFHYPAASITLLLGFVMLCFVFFPAAIYMNYTYKKDQKNPMLNLSILIGGIAFMIGVLFKLMHWPGAALLLFVGWSIILGIFLPILLFVKLKEASTRGEKSIYILGVVSLIIFEVATMFKMFHWPGAALLMILGSVLLIGVFVPLFARMKFKNGSITIAQFIFLITTSMYAVVLTSLIAMNVSDVILDRFERDATNNDVIVNYYTNKNKTDVTDTLSKLNPAITESANKIQKLILDAKLALITTIEGVDEKTAKDYIMMPTMIRNKSNYDFVNHIMMNENNNGLARTLKEELEKFRKLTADSKLSKNFEQLLDTSDKEINGEVRTWEEINFRNNMIIATMAQLSQIERNVRLVESLASRN